MGAARALPGLGPWAPLRPEPLCPPPGVSFMIVIMNTMISISVYIYIYICIRIMCYIHIQRERERDRERSSWFMCIYTFILLALLPRL